MNLEKLKALIRLANNNPNENEANLAARKACKILAEKNFALLKPQLYQPSKAQSDFHTRTTWNDVTRSEEPNFRSAYGPFDDLFRDIFNKGNKGNWPEYEYIYNNFTGKRERRQELRKCAKCGLEIMTFRIKENPWICNPCHWKEKL